VADHRISGDTLTLEKEGGHTKKDIRDQWRRETKTGVEEIESEGIQDKKKRCETFQGERIQGQKISQKGGKKRILSKKAEARGGGLWENISEGKIMRKALQFLRCYSRGMRREFKETTEKSITRKDMLNNAADTN